MIAKKKIESNSIGYVFECGCKAKFGSAYNDTVTNQIVCQKHKARIAFKVFKCRKCGIVFEKTAKSATYCDVCRVLSISDSTRKKTLVMKLKQSFDYEEKERPGFDQTRRADCRFGDRCLDRACFNDESFNCFGCRRFTPRQELDILDYTTTGFTFEVEA